MNYGLQMKFSTTVKDVGWRTLNIQISENEVEMVWPCKTLDKNSILRGMMELEVESRRPVCWPKSKIVKEEMMKLNITKDMAEDRKK